MAKKSSDVFRNGWTIAIIAGMIIGNLPLKKNVPYELAHKLESSLSPLFHLPEPLQFCIIFRFTKARQ